MRYLLFFLPCLLFSFQDQTAQKKGVVAGRVTNLFTGEPLRKVNVHLSQTGRQANAKAQGYGGLSDAQGNFRFEGVNAGQYSLRGDRSGFLPTQYGAKGPGQSGTFITLQPGQEITDLSFGLIPQAVITGRVLDEDGDPVIGVQVQGLKQSWFRGRLRVIPQSTGSSNDLGEFRIGGLAPGKYFVAVLIFNIGAGENEASAIPGVPQLHQVRTFFPDSTSLDTASQITVAAGQTASGTDIHLQRVRTFHVRGKVAGSAAEHLILSLQSKDQFGMMFGGQSAIAADRTFDIPGVAPGAYTLTAFNMGNGMTSAGARQPIEVGAADLNDVIVSIIPQGTLRGRVSVEGDGPPLKPDFHPELFLISEEGAMGMSQVKFADDGTFSIENVGPGKYYPQINNAPDGAYLKSVRVGQQELLGKELDFSNGVSGELEIVFRYGVAQVGGVIQTAPPDLTIVLVPEVLNADGSGMDFSGVDQNGAFSFKRVTPGRYLAYALEQVDTNQLQNPDVLKQLASKGVEVEVKEKDNKQIQLALIPADDLKRIFESQ